MAVYGSTREPEEEESAIAPYGSDISVYNQIAGPSSRVNADGSRKMSDAGLDIDGDAIRHLQVSLLHQHIFSQTILGSQKRGRSIYRGQSGRFAWQYQRKYSKGCKSKTYFDFYGRSSKADEKIGYVLTYDHFESIFMVFFRSKCSCFKENASIEIFGRAGKSKRDEIRSIVVKCKSIKQIDGNEIWMVIILYIHCASISVLSPTNIPFRASKNN